MPTAPFPSDESQRLAAVRALAQLDTPTEERFDRITRLARKALDVPSAIISLMDANRQWYKSCLGFDGSEKDRAVTFCSYTILQHDVLIIPDATQDPRFSDNPSVVGPPYIRFYAGVPIRSADNYNVGTFCIFDIKPRQFDEEDMNTLRDLTAWAEKEMSTAKLSIAQQDMIHQLDEPQRKGLLDTTTRLWNHDGMLKIMEKQIIFSSETRRPFAVVMLDIDHYHTLVNDYGAEAGNMVVVETAKRIKTATRDSDAIGRYGDDEFMIVLADVNADAAGKICAQILNKFMLGHFNVGEKRLPVRASIGCTLYLPDNPKDIPVLIEAAQKALQQAKDTGRNRVVMG